MPSSTIDPEKKLASARIQRLKAAVQGAKPGVCPERAMIWTEYHRIRANRKKPAVIRMAEALSLVLEKKTISIYPDELVVGNFSSRRVGGSIYPELHGVPVMLDIFKFAKRETNPLEITGRDIRRLLSIVPFWASRFLGFKVYGSPVAKLRYIVGQLRARFYLCNEAGGVSHLAPDYEKLVAMGTEGIAAEAAERQAKTEAGSERWLFFQGVKIAAEGLARFGERYARLASRMASAETDPLRKRELSEIADICQRVPRHPARSLREAAQSILFAQIAINLESLDNAVCPGRMDAYLFPLYRADLERGRTDRESAKEILAAFCVKLSEIVPVFSRFLTNFHGGMFNGQVVTVGGADGVNELSYVFLEIMDELRMRQPNFHARVYSIAPPEYLDLIYSILAKGSNSPALYNDDAIIPMMEKNGYSRRDARNYTAVGCVEPVSQGKSFSSTDAALVNVPACLEMALNGGRRFGSLIRTGPKTPPPRAMRSMEDLKSAFEIQLRALVVRLVRDLKATEAANANFHPTPLTSMLLDGCLESGICSTSGGARYNFSGLQNIAPIDIGDSLAAIERAAFVDRKISMSFLVRALKGNLRDDAVLAYLRSLPKYGNDDESADRWTVYGITAYARALKEAGLNTRGGSYVPGLYSVTAHEYFGRVTGATANGRRRGESFTSGVSAANGMDRKGPTALINSSNRIDFSQVANGVNFNLKFDSLALRGKTGIAALGSLVRTYFRRGGMQAQINVLDAASLIEAQAHPERFPNLLVRVSGYSAYFNDLSPAMQDEIIARSTLHAG
jgi:pyruvate formate-lyase/glycerol dehydratase family glycyl radical enzyme